MNTEYEIWNLMYLGFISNAMFMVAMVLLTWLGFRFAARIDDDSNANVAAKVTATLFYLLVGIMFYNTAQIGGAIIGGAAESLSALEEVSQRGQDLIDRVESGFVPGGLVSTALNVVIVFFQLAMTWGKKA